MSIFGFFRNLQAGRVVPVRPDRNRVPYPFESVREPSELDLGEPGTIVPLPSIRYVRVFTPTHIHARTGRLYMLTGDGDRLEVTGDEAYPLAEYEDREGNRYAQRSDRFHDGRFHQYEEL